MNYKKARNIIKNVKWTFAKTYADTYPHEYTLRDRFDDNQLFNDLIAFIREEGKIKNFNKRHFLYLELDGREYWEMGRPLRAVKVLNRAGIDDSQNFRHKQPQPTKKDREKLHETLKQRDYYVDYLLAKKNKTEEDKIKLKYLLNSSRWSKNIIDHSKITPRVFEMNIDELKEHINKRCNGINV